MDEEGGEEPAAPEEPTEGGDETTPAA